jgi:hypothetical protein
MRENYPYGTFAVPMSEIVVFTRRPEQRKKKVVGYTQQDIDSGVNAAAVPRATV